MCTLICTQLYNNLKFMVHHSYHTHHTAGQTYVEQSCTRHSLQRRCVRQGIPPVPPALSSAVTSALKFLGNGKLFSSRVFLHAPGQQRE